MGLRSVKDSESFAIGKPPLTEYLSIKALKRKGENLFSDTKWTQQDVILGVSLKKNGLGVDGANEKENRL